MASQNKPQNSQADDDFDVSLLEGLRERIVTEDGDEDYLSPKSTRKSILFGALIGLAAAAGAAWFVLGSEPVGQPIAEAPKEIPIIKAEKAPVKVRPADPGGMAVPNQDKLVYNRVDQSAKKPEVEHLLPPPKEPTALPKTEDTTKTSASPKTAGKNDGLGDGMAPLSKAAATKTPEPPPITKPEIVKTAKVTPPPAVKKQPVKTKAKQETTNDKKTLAKAEVAPKPTKVISSAKSGGWQIQLAALRDQARAEAAWKRTVKKAQGALNNVPHEIIRVDLGSKGVFYRLRAGSFVSRDGASALCSKLKAKGVGCVVAKR